MVLFTYRIAYRKWLLVGMSGWSRLYLKTCTDFVDCLTMHTWFIMYHILQNNFPPNEPVFNKSVLFMCTIMSRVLASMNMTSCFILYFVKMMSKRPVAPEDFLVKLKVVHVVYAAACYIYSCQQWDFPANSLGFRKPSDLQTTCRLHSSKIMPSHNARDYPPSLLPFCNRFGSRQYGLVYCYLKIAFAD